MYPNSGVPGEKRQDWGASGTYNRGPVDFSASGLFLSLLIGAVGAGLFIYGRKQQRFPQMIGGGLLSLYPYFVSNLWLMGGIAVAIVAGVWIATRLGY